MGSTEISKKLLSIANDLRSMAMYAEMGYAEMGPTEPVTFKEGQLVRRVQKRDDNGGPGIGTIGVVRHVDHKISLSTGVEWAGFNTGGCLLGHIKSKCGWYVALSDLELCNPGEA